MVVANNKDVVNEGPNMNVYPWTIVAYFLDTNKTYPPTIASILNAYGFGLPQWLKELLQGF